MRTLFFILLFAAIGFAMPVSVALASGHDYFTPSTNNGPAVMFLWIFTLLGGFAGWAIATDCGSNGPEDKS